MDSAPPVRPPAHAGGETPAVDVSSVFPLRVRMQPGSAELSIQVPVAATATDVVAEVLRNDPLLCRISTSTSPIVSEDQPELEEAACAPQRSPHPSRPVPTLHVMWQGHVLPASDPITRHGVGPGDLLELVERPAIPSQVPDGNAVQQQPPRPEQGEPLQERSPHVVFAGQANIHPGGTAELPRPCERGYAAIRDIMRHCVGNMGFSPAAAARTAEVAAAIAIAADCARSPAQHPVQTTQAEAIGASALRPPSPLRFLLRVARDDVAACALAIGSADPPPQQLSGNGPCSNSGSNLGDGRVEEGGIGRYGIENHDDEDPATVLSALLPVLGSAMIAVGNRAAEHGSILVRVPAANPVQDIGVLDAAEPSVGCPGAFTRRTLLAHLGAVAAAVTSATAALAEHIELIESAQEAQVGSPSSFDLQGASRQVPQLSTSDAVTASAQNRSHRENRNLSEQRSAPTIAGEASRPFSTPQGPRAFDVASPPLPDAPETPPVTSADASRTLLHQPQLGYRPRDVNEVAMAHSRSGESVAQSNDLSNTVDGLPNPGDISAALVLAFLQIGEAASLEFEIGNRPGADTTLQATGRHRSVDSSVFPRSLLSLLHLVGAPISAALTHPSIDGNPSLLSFVRSSSSAVIRDRYLHGDVSLHNIENAINNQLGNRLEYFMRLLHRIALARDMYRPSRDDITFASVLIPIIRSRLTQFALLLFENIPDADIFNPIRQLLDDAVGEFMFEMSRQLGNGIDDAIQLLALVLPEMLRNIVGHAPNDGVVSNFLSEYVRPVYESWRIHVEGSIEREHVHGDVGEIRNDANGTDVESESGIFSDIADELIAEISEEEGLIGNDDMDVLVAELVAEEEPRSAASESNRLSPIAPFPPALRVQPMPALRSQSRRNNDGLDDLLGMRGAARIRAILQNDSVRISRMCHRTRLSRAYRGSGDPLEPLNVEAAASFSAKATRESAHKMGLQGPELEALACQAGSQHMGRLMLHEIESMIRSRLATDQDFDPDRFPNAAQRFGLTR